MLGNRNSAEFGDRLSLVRSAYRFRNLGERPLTEAVVGRTEARKRVVNSGPGGGGAANCAAVLARRVIFCGYSCFQCPRKIGTRQRTTGCGTFAAPPASGPLSYPLRRTSLSIQPRASVVVRRSPSFALAESRITLPPASYVIV